MNHRQNFLFPTLQFAFEKTKKIWFELSLLTFSVDFLSNRILLSPISEINWRCPSKSVIVYFFLFAEPQEYLDQIIDTLQLWTIFFRSVVVLVIFTEFYKIFYSNYF